MLCLSSLLLLLLLSLLSCFTLVSCSLAENSHLHTSGQVLVSLGGKRLLAENSSEVVEQPDANSSDLVLAEKRTYRKDPLNGFKKYTGGWNISERHYWASVAYTAAPFFVVAGIWFVIFGLCLFSICLYYCCCPRPPYGYSRTAYALSLILLILFTIAAIIGCVVLYTGQGKYHSSTINTLEYVVHQANSTAEQLGDVSEYLAAAKLIAIDRIPLAANVQTDIDEIQTKINSSASTLSTRAADNSDDIKHLIESVRLALIILSAVMLLLTFLGFGGNSA